MKTSEIIIVAAMRAITICFCFWNLTTCTLIEMEKQKEMFHRWDMEKQEADKEKEMRNK